MQTMVGKQTPQHHPPIFTNILTPDRIPEFCIPPRRQVQKELKVIPQWESIPDLNGLVFETIKPCSFDAHTIQVDSVAESTDTNADPQSQAALSLPHLLKAHTCYGFCTLLESPNTRRKESIFHNDLANPLILLPRSNTVSCRKSTSQSNISTKLSTLHRSGTIDSDTISSTESTPLSSPLLQRSLPMTLLKAFNQDKIFSKGLKVGFKSSQRHNSVSTDEDSSTDSSPSVTRRTSQDWAQTPHALSHTGLFLSPRQFPMDNTLKLDTGGILRLSTEYRSECLRLHIRLVSAEGLYRQSVDPKHISCCISLSVVPGKSQKQRSTLIRGSRNPIFNEDFYFEGLNAHDLLQKTLKIKALNKGSGVRRETILGKCKLHLLSVLVL
ncbi:C2 calcium-dependent domain-containing protein 4C-like [Hyperolius riggenbachi]|uniref:C2 calcium-dependent domain-containing protein 4C-like n=1 Tax=Hyperolius riggenbachi TaxID=752182 RepID=UPI0035A2F311